MKIDWKLKGSNLLRFSCGKDVTIHPETCADNVLMGHSSELSLTDWITNSGQYPDVKSSLSDWLSDVVVSVIYTPEYNDLTAENSMLLGTMNDVPVRVPWGTKNTAVSPIYGVFQAGDGLSVTNGILGVSEATSSVYGGIKLGFQSTATAKAVQLSNGKAFVDVSNINPQTYLYEWTGGSATKITQKVATVFTTPTDPNGWEGDALATLFNDRDYLKRIGSIYTDNTPSYIQKFVYPIRASDKGYLYTVVPWTDTNTTYEFRNSTNSNQFLWRTGGAANWNTITILPSISNNTTNPTSGTTNCLAKFTGNNTIGNGPQLTNKGTRFLKENGTWDTPPIYYGDDDTIVLTVDDQFKAVQTYTQTVAGESQTSLETFVSNFYAQKTIDYNLVGTSSDDLVAGDIKYIIANGIIGSELITSADQTVILNYNFELDVDYSDNLNHGVARVVFENDNVIKAIKDRDLIINGYGDLTLRVDDPLDLSATSRFEIEITPTKPNTHSHFNLTFKVVSSAPTYLTIVCKETAYTGFTAIKI